ncbi:hypothetical protein Nos7107_0674 [Nostoc sp. PCC 7107]|nr:hypothetical protein Nos7107_0674 [Nostoc sp. PCC 7107]
MRFARLETSNTHGDRKYPPIYLLQIQPVGADKYDFVPIPR